jgi:hypothetical protein
MYYVNLGLSKKRRAPPPADAYNPFINLADDVYWSETVGSRAGKAWGFDLLRGSQDVRAGTDLALGWAVMDGDVGTARVPEPATLVLFGLGLLAFARFHRRTR